MLHDSTETILCLGRVAELEVFHSPRTVVLPISSLVPMSTKTRVLSSTGRPRRKYT